MNKKRTFLFIICIVIIASSVGYLSYHFTSLNKDKKIYDNLKEIAVSEDSSTSEMDSNVVSKTAYVSKINFNELEAQNNDIYAWINIPDTGIDYPILQHSSVDDYYLNHSVDGSDSIAGAIFTDCENDQTFKSFNEVIYGHDMKNESMFGGLYRFRNADYLDSHRYVYIYTPNSCLKYKIFASVIYDDCLITKKYNNNVIEDRQAFLDSLSKSRDLGGILLDDTNVTTDSRVITLSTCVGSMEDKRFIIVAVLVDEQT